MARRQGQRARGESPLPVSESLPAPIARFLVTCASLKDQDELLEEPAAFPGSRRPGGVVGFLSK